MIEDDYRINGPEVTSRNIANVVKEKESALWGADGKPYRRISDNNNVTFVNSIGQEGVWFNLTTKEHLDAMVNDVRLLVTEGRLIVHPRCKYLIDCLRYGIWTKKRDKFARSLKLGHYDALAALVYLVRNLDRYTNPIPANYRQSIYTHQNVINFRPSEAALVWKGLLGARRK